MWQKLSKREKVLLALLAGVLVVFGAYRYALAPFYRQYVRQVQDLNRVHGQLQVARAAAAAMPGLEKQYELVKSEQASTLQGLDAEMRDGGVVVDLGLAAIGCNVKIVGFQAGSVVEEKDLLELPVDMEARGQYHALMEFMAGLEKQTAVPNLISVRKFFLGTDPQKAGETVSPEAITGPEDLQAKLSLVFYSENSPAGHLALEQIAAWSVGRADPYFQAGMMSPFNGVEPLGEVPAEANPNAGGAQPGGTAPGGSQTAGNPAGTLSSLEDLLRLLNNQQKAGGQQPAKSPAVPQNQVPHGLPTN